MDGIGNAISGMFVTLVICGFIIGGITVGGFWFIVSKDYIESKTKIVPEIKLETDGKKIDTVYIYKNQ